jgi:hydroxymethylpyrimidine pyrophosphatase-like HAD family hydrolase/fructoselysine-6-P-deglycase FrlB-like protein
LGKSYSAELELLPETFSWAMHENIDELVRAIKASCTSGLICIGSGGSYSAAVLASWIHQEYTGHLGLPATPLQAARTAAVKNCAMLILSAGGRNPDVLGVLRHIVKQEPRALAVMCLTKGSPIADLCAEYRFIHCAEFASPAGKDGFVATNSLVAIIVLLWRAYAEVVGLTAHRDLTLQELLGAKSGLAKWSAQLAESCSPLWARPYLVVLHGAAATQAGAVDLESKFSEAAVGPIQIADYRNFAHGRHHWLDKKGDETGLLALISEEDEDLAEKTLALVPRNVRVARVRIEKSGPLGAIEATIKALFIAGFAAAARGIDAGRPKVASFGRRIYHLNAWSSKREAITTDERLAIERKVSRPLRNLGRPELEYWRAEYRKFVSAITTAQFHALVLDYDGTLCDERYRFGNLPRIVANPLNELLHKGVLLGIATGRGKSVRKALQESIEQPFWPRVVIAYYNGSEIASLEDEQVPQPNCAISAALEPLAQQIRASRVLNALADHECKTNQISVVAKNPSHAEKIYKVVCDLISSKFAEGVSCVRSSHSVDILAPGITKLALLDNLKVRLKIEFPQFLCIGDLGSWPGNDYLLLSTPYSLSSHEPSSAPDRCWNLAPAGMRNAQATEFFLHLAKASKGMFRFQYGQLFAATRRKGA